MAMILRWMLAFGLMGGIAQAQPLTTTLTSPDGKLSIRFTADTAGKTQPLTYRVSLNGNELLKPSALQLELEGQPALGTNVRIVETSITAADQTYTLPTGKTRTVRDRYNALNLNVVETTAPQRHYRIEARAYNDAVAFRYVVPEQPATQNGYRLTNERTEFHFAKDANTYAQVLPHYRSMYESEYLPLPVSAFSNQGGVKSNILIGLPLLAEVPGAGWVAIAEADLKGYTSMYLSNLSGGWAGHTLTSRLAPRIGDSTRAVVGKGELRSAWRIVMAAKEPGKLLESNALMNLSEPSAIPETSWIRAGKASWDWWNGSLNADGKSAYTTQTMKYYVDFAAQQGLEYMLVDAGWSQYDITQMKGNVNIPELVNYAAAKNVKIWIWLFGKAVDKQMDEAFALYEKWGVAGLKVDFIERDDQDGIAFYYRMAQKAADHHLMLDLHGCTKPFGLERTYPNILGYEAILGMEQSKGGSRDNPNNHVMLAYTRQLVGPMDYTPGGFNNVTRDAFTARDKQPLVMGTRAHHLALYVVYPAPFNMVSDFPETYKANAADFTFIKNVPATWDETRFVNGTVGESITMARRAQNDWYVGSITNWAARSVEIPLTFLGAGNYTAEIYADAPDAGRQPTKTRISRQTVTKNTVLKEALAPGGGLAIRIRKL